MFIHIDKEKFISKQMTIIVLSVALVLAIAVAVLAWTRPEGYGLWCKENEGRRNMMMYPQGDMRNNYPRGSESREKRERTDEKRYYRNMDNTGVPSTTTPSSPPQDAPVAASSSVSQ